MLSQKEEGGVNVLPQDFPSWVRSTNWAQRTKDAYCYWFDRWCADFKGPSEETVEAFLSANPSLPARATVKNWLLWKKSNYIMPKAKGHLAQKLPRWLTYAEIQTLIKHAKDTGHEKEGLLVRLLFETGLRANEMGRLLAGNINFQTKMIEGVGKGNKEYRIKLRDGTLNTLKRYIEANIIGLDEPLFGWNRQTIFFHVWRLSKEVLKKPIGPHVLRHSLATFMLQKGMSLPEVQQRLRHNRMATTMVYLHANPTQVDNKINKLFDEEKKKESEKIEETGKGDADGSGMDADEKDSVV